MNHAHPDPAHATDVPHAVSRRGWFRQAGALVLVLGAGDLVHGATLVAVRETTNAGPVYRFDIYMQDSAAGKETVFFDL